MSIIIPLEKIKQITGATSDAIATAQWRYAVGVIEGYLGVTLFKTDFKDEKITVPYGLSKVIATKHGPINSVCDFSVISSNGTYTAKTSALSFCGKLIEVLSGFWDCISVRILPQAVSAVQVSYNAGLYDDIAQVPDVLLESVFDLLDYKYNSDAHIGFTSEHLGDYSYSRGSFVRGLPAEIAGALDGLNL